jgi:hypothetical protein
VTKVENVLQSDLLLKGLVVVPSAGASPASIQAEESAIEESLSSAFRHLLSRWNGLDLEVIRLFGCAGGVTEQLRRTQLPALIKQGYICIGSDPSGFRYCENREGHVFSFDTDGGRIKKLANSFDDFIERLVFGRDGEKFSGQDWADELRRAGLI